MRHRRRWLPARLRRPSRAALDDSARCQGLGELHPPARRAAVERLPDATPREPLFVELTDHELADAPEQRHAPGRRVLAGAERGSARRRRRRSPPSWRRGTGARGGPRARPEPRCRRSARRYRWLTSVPVTAAPAPATAPSRRSRPLTRDALEAKFSGEYTTRIQVPTFIGEVGLNTRSMLRKRSGRPRSLISARQRQQDRAAGADTAASCQRGRPVASATAARSELPPARPPRNR